MRISTTPGTLAETAAARVQAAAPVGRLSLRTRDREGLAGALGLELPGKIGQRARTDRIEVLCLGPDEWTLRLDPDAVAGVLAKSAGTDIPHALVDISAREVTLLIDGPRTAELLTLGCPRDIATIPPGQARRTVFDGATVILWHDEPGRFRMDIWNSFAPHLLHLLATGCRELAADPV